MQNHSTVHPKQISLSVACWSGTHLRQQKKKKGCRWEAEKNCAQCEWLSTMRVEMKPGFSYQTNKSHMERERERGIGSPRWGLMWRAERRDRGSAVFFLRCCENRHRDSSASSSHSIMRGLRKQMSNITTSNYKCWHHQHEATTNPRRVIHVYLSVYPAVGAVFWNQSRSDCDAR